MSHLQQILDLQKKSPRMGMSVLNSINSDYTSHCSDLKNCYLLIGSEKNEDCLYGNWVYESRDCVDCGFVFKCELLYECIDCENCYNCDFSQDCTTCTDCGYCYDCKSCQNCLGCVGLRNKNFHVLNKPVSREEFLETKKQLISDKNFAAEFFHKFEKLKQATPRLYNHISDNENCVGDYLYHSKNSFACFDCKYLEDSSYMTSSIKNKDCFDMANSYYGCELSYEIMSSIELYNCNFSNFCYYCRDLEYCEWCFHCSDCFGCFYLQHKQYYIFNQPYSREEYFKKLAEIKTQMRADNEYGKHLPATITFEDSAVLNYFR